MKYRFGITQKVFEEATVEVEADTEEAAQAILTQRVNDGDVQWRFLENSGGFEVATVSAA